jgi:NNP family nitrate/nitrite transporter-like MFS transporter
MQSVLSALRAGHWPSLIAAWIHFEVSFMVWLLVGALGVFIADEFHLTPTEKGFMVAVPLLSGAIWRVFIGACSDRFGPKPTGLVVLMCELLALVWGWTAAETYGQVLGLGLALGMAGASFAVALPLASCVYPPAHQGLAMGVAASANSGTVLAAFFAPRLGEIVGWHGVFGVMMVPVLIALALFAALVRGTGAPEPRGGRWFSEVLDLFKRPSVYWLCFVYAVTFGGFVGFPVFCRSFFTTNTKSISLRPAP